MSYKAKIIKDSISPAGVRLVTMELTYPRFIHPEFMTHRSFARNASSSRAIPISNLVEDAINNPAGPISWGANQPGMQAARELMGAGLIIAQDAWLKARDAAVEQARILANVGAHKQIVNRLLEPFTHIRVVVTATEWSNFFALRRHPDAQPEMKYLADLMWEAMQASKPALRQPGQWHLPYIEEEDWDNALTSPDETLDTDPEAIKTLLKISTARCARVSYRLHDGAPSTIEKDLALYDRLVGANPKHASPAEHQATPDQEKYSVVNDLAETRIDPPNWRNPHLHGPFVGWVQHRKLLPDENIKTYSGE